MTGLLRRGSGATWLRAGFLALGVLWWATASAALDIQPIFVDTVEKSWSDLEKGTMQAAIASWEAVLGIHIDSAIDPVVVATFTFGSLGTPLGQWTGNTGFQSIGADLFPWTSGVTHTITFNTDKLGQLYFDADTSSFDVPGGLFDAYSVAQHELGHMLGFVDNFYRDNFGTPAPIDKWTTHIVGTTFDPGGLNVPMNADLSHLSEIDLLTGGLLESPILAAGSRPEISSREVEMLALAYGYEVVPEPSTALLVAAGLVALGRRRSA